MNKNVAHNVIRIDEIVLTLDESEDTLAGKIAGILGVGEKDIVHYAIARRAIDSRKKENILCVYSVTVKLKDPQSYLSRQKRFSSTLKKKVLRHKVRWQKPYAYDIKQAASNP